MSNTVKTEILQFLKLRSPLSINSEYIDPNYLDLVINSTVVYDPSLTNKTKNEIATNVMTTIETYNTESLLDFDNDFRYSKFVSAIDDTASYIISNSTDIIMAKDYLPLLGENLIFSVEFRNEILRDDNVQSRQLTNEFTVYSSEITYNGTPAYFGEDGSGKMFVFEYTELGRKILNSDCGTVNYTTGKININNVTIDSYSGSAIKFYAIPKKKDIFVLRNTIIRIDTNAINIVVEEI